jgi:hypothetical protein
VNIDGATAALRLPAGFPLTNNKINYDTALSSYRVRIAKISSGRLP